jgi:putative sterol carrier protein
MSEIKELMDSKLKNLLSADPLCMKASGINGVKVGIDIENEGSWSFVFDSAGAVTMSQGLEESCHCSVHASSATFIGVIKGTVNVPFAYLTKKIKIKGDMGLAVKIGLGIQKAIEAKK